MSLAVGEHLGPYEILAPLGHGGMGEVYRARDTRLQREVAVKVLRESIMHDADSLSRFERETRAVAALNHPNIVAIHDVGEHSGLPYAVTELLDGETLAEKLTAGTLSARRAFEIACQVADGIASAHEKGIVHRDLKPANIFLTRAGSAKILDFGIARFERPVPIEEATSAATAEDTTRGLLGTVGYVSPEQVRGQPVDARTDIFSLGAVLYEMLTGRKAFSRPTPIETLGAVLEDEPATFPEAERIPADLRWIVLRCLEKEPSERFQSARDLFLDLRAVAAGSSARKVAASTSRRDRMPRLLASALTTLPASRRTVDTSPSRKGMQTRTSGLRTWTAQC